jgi:glycosyltransferase involved in cell wall biosynthesis
VACHVSVVPRLCVPVEITHEGAYRSIWRVPVPEHVALNALFLAPGVSGGPETYLRGLAPALATEFPQLRLTIVTTEAGASHLRELGFEDFAQVRALRCEDGQRVRRTMAEQLWLPRAARDVGAQLIHSLASTAPLYPRLPAVVTLHDVTFLRMRTFGAVTTFGMRHVIAGAARRADVLLTGTVAARDEICATLGLDPARFLVVPHGHGRATVAQPVPEQEIRARYHLDGARVVLCVAAKRPHKNQEVLVRAAAQLAPDVVVVLVGHAEPYEATLRALAQELGVSDRVRFVAPVPDGELEGLWHVADCFAFPTLGEGFGIPLLEAMEHGLAVACSDLPVLREIGGDVPIYFDPRSPGDAAQAIDVALADPVRAARGPAVAAGFTWERAAKGTYAGYERALAPA